MIKNFVNLSPTFCLEALSSFSFFNIYPTTIASYFDFGTFFMKKKVGPSFSISNESSFHIIDVISSTLLFGFILVDKRDKNFRYKNTFVLHQLDTIFETFPSVFEIKLNFSVYYTYFYLPNNLLYLAPKTFEELILTFKVVKKNQSPPIVITIVSSVDGSFLVGSG